MTKRVVRKSASQKPVRRSRVVSDAMDSPEANDEVILAGKDTSGPAKKQAKVVQLIVSIGNEDRSRTHEEMVADILKKLGVKQGPRSKWFCMDCNAEVPLGVSKCPKCNHSRFKMEVVGGIHAVVTGGYYILDGKVCLPDDYDPKRQTFKKGSTPPTWAGGPKTSTVSIGHLEKQLEYDKANLSSDEYDKKYRLGKYAPPKPPSETRHEHDARMKREREARAQAAEDELEVFDWDEDEVMDDDAMGKTADASASRAIRKLKNKKPRHVVKRKGTDTGDAPPKRKVVKRRGN